MKSCRTLVFSILLLQISVTFPRQIGTIVEVKQNENATLPCTQMCSGHVTWTDPYETSITHNKVAQCNQTLCQSKEGFQMSHDQYLKGDFSLTITDADFTKSGWYTCECDDVEMCRVRLQLEPLSLAFHLKHGHSLSMDVPMLDPVAVFFTSAGDARPNPVRLCEIEGCMIWRNFHKEYENRTSFSSSLHLQEMKESDSGVYTIKDRFTCEVLATYRVNVNASSVQPGETLTLQLPSLDLSPSFKWSFYMPVIVVLFKKADDDDTAVSIRMCTIRKFHADCNSEYKRRVSFSSSVQLKEMNESDSGVYTIQDTRNNEVIATYTVTVNVFHLPINKKPGDSLMLDVPFSEPVEVTFNGIGDTSQNGVILCNITGRIIQCSSEYQRRVSFSSSLQLKDMKQSDTGIYTIWDTENYELIATYITTVTVNGLSQVSQNVTDLKLNENITLSCNQTCSGLVTWTVNDKPHDILAHCNQTSCWSEEGFHMSHDQYLKGDLSLTITDADYTKRVSYICECDGTDLCDVRLRLKPPTYHISVQPGESLIMDVPISEPVVVLFNQNSAASPHNVTLCEITGREIKCNSEYERRLLFSSSLQLKEMNESDGGVYTIRDTKNDEVIGTYTVTISDAEPRQDQAKSNHVGIIVATVVVLVVLVVLVVGAVVKQLPLENMRLNRQQVQMDEF